MNPVPWLQMTNMISYQGLVRTFLSSIFLSTGIGHMYQSMGFTSSYIVLGGIALCFTLISFITLDKARAFAPQPAPAH